jgi:dTDP-4-dehydrorhamnose 3,5-epimerase
MTRKETPISGLFEIHPTLFQDSRGYFFESFREDTFSNWNFVQDNESLSQKDVLRGLHFQAPPYEQGKLVRVIKGAVLDVALDIRLHSPTYGKHYSQILTEQNKIQLWIPPGFAHGFLVLRPDTIFSYKCTNYYHKASEGCILWNDSDLNIQWNINHPILSEKDKNGTPFSGFLSPFAYE